MQELDRVAAESVRKKFERINAFLFEGKSTGTRRVDEECKEWSCTFPHFEYVRAPCDKGGVAVVTHFSV